jgi:hypothetical protein
MRAAFFQEKGGDAGAERCQTQINRALRELMSGRRALLTEQLLE